MPHNCLVVWPFQCTSNSNVIFIFYILWSFIKFKSFGNSRGNSYIMLISNSRASFPAQILSVIVPLIRYFQNHFYCPFGSALMRYVLLIRRFKMGSLEKHLKNLGCSLTFPLKWSCGTTSKLSYSNSSFRAVFASISMSHFKCFVSWPSSSKLSLILVFEL